MVWRKIKKQGFNVSQGRSKSIPSAGYLDTFFIKSPTCLDPLPIYLYIMTIRNFPDVKTRGTRKTRKGGGGVVTSQLLRREVCKRKPAHNFRAESTKIGRPL